MAVSPRGHPYADPNERVRDWPASSQALATVLDAEMPTYGGTTVGGNPAPIWGATQDFTKRIRLHIVHLSGTSSALGNFSFPWPQPALNCLGLVAWTVVADGNVQGLVNLRSNFCTATDCYLRTSALSTGAPASNAPYNVAVMAWWQAVAAG